MPSASFSHTVTVAAPRDRVWAALDKPETWNGIAGVDRVHQAVVDEEGKLRGFLFDTMVGGTAYEGKATPHSREEGEAMAWELANSQVKGQIHIDLADAAGGDTRMTVVLEIASAGFMAGMFFSAIANAVGTGFPATVDAMAASLSKNE